MSETFGGDMAFPVSQETARNLNNPYQTGLTKREYFAGLAMQGLLISRMDSYFRREGVVKDAVALADALIAELRQ